MELVLFSGGAAHGLVHSLEAEFGKQTGFTLQGSYGAVGVYRDKFLAGEHADMLILSRPLIDALAQDGHIAPDDIFDIGPVRTAVAVRAGDPKPDIASEDSVRAALAAATDIYFPDPKLATAGIHFARVMQACGVDLDADPRLRPHPNGASAMKAMAAQSGGRPIGSTQITEILPIEGVETIGMLPGEFELATVYTIGIPVRCRHRQAAQTLASLLTSADNETLRRKAGVGL
ncbi:MAG: molybdate ABC transporter substrate-binding protein [Beijerinckiaceae bacterium]